MNELKVPFTRAKPGRYAGGLRALSRTSEPHRKLDLLLTGALIEARSAERFAALAPRLPAPLDRFYATAASVPRRATSSSICAWRYRRRTTSGLNWRERLEVLASREAELATTPDDQFRFHSGPPPPRAS